MDVAYDHIQEEVLSAEDAAKKEDDKRKESNLKAEFEDAYKSFSASPWGAKLGGFFSDVKKQGENYYEGARQEASVARGEALKGFTDLKSTLVSRARSLSTGQTLQADPATAGTHKELNVDVSTDASEKQRSESEALRESEGLISRFRTEAAKRLKDIEKAEDAADEALIKFGTNIRNFLRDAVSIAPPSAETNKDGTQKVLFESRDQDGKRVIHSTRFDAQLHAIHSSIDSFAKDPVSSEYEKWKTGGFDVDKKTEAIATDLEKYEELRRAMEKLVPEKVEYAQFWTRYYFLRMVVETEEQRRRDMLKGAALSPTENISWDDDSDSDSQPSTPHGQSQQPSSSTTTLHPVPAHSSSTPHPEPSNADPSPHSSTPKATDTQPRRSQDQHSQPDSDASYDLVSGATSRAPGSPKEDKEGEGEQGRKEGKKEDEDEEEPDWE
ncbi:hypothetical protein MMC07_009347 [Pseudocyphellaria aurata]|nr:hypothetical protein [Pseudocyphellaria aurata]